MKICSCLHGVVGLVACLLSWTSAGCSGGSTIDPLPANRIEATALRDGSTFHLADDGNVYRETAGGKKWTFHSQVFDPTHFKNAYLSESDVVYRISPDNGQRYKTIRRFEEDFEDLEPGLPGLRKLLSEERRRWGSLTLQSPKAPSVQEYVDVRNKIMKSQAGFLDAKIEPTSGFAHSGQRSLRFSSPPKTSSMVTCKSSLSCPLIYFRNKDDLWFEAWYWVEEEYPLTLADFECEFVAEHPGIRVRLYDSGSLGAELKALDKPQFRQPTESAVSFPKKEWVHVRLHLYLSPTAGQIEIWQNGRMVLQTSGPTLPFRSAIYNSLEIGISAYSETQGESVLFIDDVRLSDKPFDDPTIP